MNLSLGEIADWVGGTVVGDSAVRITGLNSIRQAAEGDLTFVADPRYASLIERTHATAILVPPAISRAPRPLIQVDDPYGAMLTVVRRLWPESGWRPTGIHPTAVIGAGVRLGKDVAIDAQVCIGDDCRIGDGAVLYAGVYVGFSCIIGPNTVIYPNVTIREGTTIGSRCTIHSGAVLGADGFGFSLDDGTHRKIPQVGVVTIGDDVEIGANTAIDRATFGSTVVGSGTKIDNLVQIGHNVQIGRNCIICANVGIAGSAILGDNVTIGGGAGIIGHIEVGAGAVVAGYSGVTKAVPPHGMVFGYPAVEYERNKRMHAALRQLPETLRRIRTLEKRIEELEGQLHGIPEDDR